MPQYVPFAKSVPGLKKWLCRNTALTTLPFLALPLQAGAQEEDRENVITLSPIILQALPYTGEIDGYLAPGTETGVKSGVPLSEVPQSISVVTSTELEARQLTQVEDAIKYTAGVNPSTWGTDDRFDQFAVRGFDLGSNALYRDGLPQKVLGFSAFSSDPYMLERVDVLRGPAGILYGSNDAGGMVNLVTKRPVFDRMVEGRLGYGSHGTIEAGFDIGNALDKSDTLAGRLTGLIRNGSTEVEHSENDRVLLSGGLTWAPTDYTSVTILAHGQKSALTPITMFPVSGEDYNTAWGRLPDDFAYKQSPYNHFETEQQSFGWDITHEFTPYLTFNSRMRYARQKTDYTHLDYSHVDESGLNYYVFRNDENAKTIGLDNNLEWKTSFGCTENSLTVGADFQRSQNTVTQYKDDTLYNVGFDAPSLDFAVTDPPLSSRNRRIYREKGIYLQDHLKFSNGTTITAGLRQSWLENQADDLIGNTSEQQKNSATTAMIGATHSFANGVTPYLNYSEGFIQNVGLTIDDKPLDPSRNKQWEIGVRYQPSDDLLLSAAAFDLRKTNVRDYYFDEAGNIDYSHFLQVGAIRAHGVELEARGRLTETLQAVAGYTYLDTRITKTADSDKENNENSMAPHHQLSLWLDWDASRFLPDLSVGAGVRYQSESFSTQYNKRTTPAYITADIALRYEADDYTVNFGVTNLFGEDYFGVCYDDYACAKGEGRNASLTLSRSF